jgi:aspartyl-tRNA(Asn)/glutamyl-tRNA(Gln) amidotransferase subunit A
MAGRAEIAPGAQRLSAVQLVRKFKAKELSPVEALIETIAGIEAMDPKLGAFLTLAGQQAMVTAKVAERAYLRDTVTAPLLGVPVAVKDLFDTLGIRTTYGSKIYRHHRPTQDAELVERAKGAGLIMLGKTSTHEFGWGITNENPHYGACHNPWDTDMMSGGSSGGSAVAVASGMTPIALGTDTGGSIRIPAAFCGVLGLKPTFGWTGSRGTMPLAPSLDTPGLLARTPADLRLALHALSHGAVPKTSDTPAVSRPLTGLRLAVVPDSAMDEVNQEVAQAYERAREAFTRLGAQLSTVPRYMPSHAIFSTIQGAEALAVHRAAGLYPMKRGSYGHDVAMRLDHATKIGASELCSRLRGREELRSSLLNLLATNSLLLTPVAPSTAPRLSTDLGDTSEHAHFRESIMNLTAPQNLAGLPACSVRAGFDQAGLPIGIQLTGSPFNEDEILRAVECFFAETDDIQTSWPHRFAGW